MCSCSVRWSLWCGTTDATGFVIDITRELFSAPVYPGDPPSCSHVVSGLEEDDYAVSSFSACCHSGTHLDAPSHVFPDGRNATQLPLEQMIGACVVLECDSCITMQDAQKAMQTGCKRVLWKTGESGGLTIEAARVFAENQALLVGVDSVHLAARAENELEVHRILLGADIAVLEGLDLTLAEVGSYDLCALPLKLGGMEASPVRAVLFPKEK